MAPTRFEFRLDDALKAAAQREAEEMGIDLAEFVRQAMTFRMLWITLVRSIQHGADLEGLGNIDALSRALAELSHKAKP